MGKKSGWMETAIVAAALLLSVMGCSSENTVKDPDRVVVEYNRQMWLQAQVIAAGIGTSAPDAATALSGLCNDGIVASNHLVTIWGPPKVAPPAYSPENLKTAIDQSTKAHASLWLHPWAMAGYGAMAVLMGLKLAGSFFPGVGTFLSSAAGEAIKTIGGALVNLKHKADSAPDDKIHLSDIQAEISTARQNPAIESILTKIHVDKLLDSSLVATALGSAAPAAAAPGPAAAAGATINASNSTIHVAAPASAPAA